MTINNMSKIVYPYLPVGREIFYVPATNKFMKAAKELALTSGCRKQATAAVIIKNGKVVASGTNSGIRVEICPRILRRSKTGTDYELCKTLCKQKGHAEKMAVEDAKKHQIDVGGADLYLFGHWWCCEPCWNAMIETGIKNVYLETGSHETSQNSRTAYISEPLTGTGERRIFEKIAMLCNDLGITPYLPHIFADPITSPKIPAKTVWKWDHQEVSSSDVLIAYVGKPSLGVGAELEIARNACRDIILWYFKGEKVSRMALGNPAVKKIIIAKNEDDLYDQLKKNLS